MNKRSRQFLMIFFAVLVIIFGFAYFHDRKASQQSKGTSSQTTKTKQVTRAAGSSSDNNSSASGSDLPDVSADDWQLIVGPYPGHGRRRVERVRETLLPAVE